MDNDVIDFEKFDSMSEKDKLRYLSKLATASIDRQIEKIDSKLEEIKIDKEELTKMLSTNDSTIEKINNRLKKINII